MPTSRRQPPRPAPRIVAVRVCVFFPSATPIVPSQCSRSQRRSRSARRLRAACGFVLAVWLVSTEAPGSVFRAPLLAPQRARLDQLGEMRDGARLHQRLAHEQPARARLDRDVDLLACEPPRPRPNSLRRGSYPAALTPPVSLSRASKVICARCTSNPATIATRASSSSGIATSRESLALSRGGPIHAISARPAVAARPMAFRGCHPHF